jgi:hypothetical protein
MPLTAHASVTNPLLASVSQSSPSRVTVHPDAARQGRPA